MAPVRVAQVMGYMNGGGVEAAVMNYYRHIDRSRVQFDFLVCEGSTLIPREEIESLGGRIFIVPSYSSVIGYQKKLLSLFHGEGWPIVHSHISSLSVFPLRAAEKAGVPVRIAHSHSTAGKGEYAKNAVKYMLRPFASRYPTHRFACGQYAGEWLFGKDSEFEIVYNAIELDRFAFDSKSRVETRAGFGLSESQLVIGHVGRFMSQKNHVFLIKAFAKLLDRRPDAVLLLAGDGEKKNVIERMVVKYGIEDRVKFLGRRSDVPRLYSSFDAFVLPSLYEGLCLVGVEAQKAGLPCILSNAITREVDVTRTCEFLPIDDAGLWADEMARVKVGSHNKVNSDDFIDYDIRQQGARLTNLYCRLFEQCAQ